MTVGVPGSPQLLLVGIADSVTGTGDGWVWPGQADVLQAKGVSTTQQMLYRFTAHGTDAQLRTSLATATRALPADALSGSTSYLVIRQRVNRSISANVPFVVAFAVLGLILAVLITANVVNGAVVAGFRTIGVLKTLGYTPGQVVAVYVAQVLVPAIVGSVAGVALGVALAVPLLSDTTRAYNLPASLGGVPIWAIVLVLVGAPLLVAAAATGPALRAGRLAANQAISVGRAPRAGRGFRLRRALAASRLPQPVSLGLGMPLARPARAVGALVALLLGAVTLVFAVGLAASLSRVHAGFTRVASVPIEVELVRDGPVKVGPGQAVTQPGNAPPDIVPVDPVATARTVAAMAGTAHSSTVSEIQVRAAGVGPEITIEGYTGDASWAGFPMISGHWYAGTDQVVASTYLLRQTGHHVGDTLTLTGTGTDTTGTGPAVQRTVTIVGEFLDGSNRLNLVGDASLLALGGDIDQTRIEVGLVPGTNVGAYARALQAQFPDNAGVFVDDRTRGNQETTFAILDALIGTLTLLLCAVAALGVLNTVVLNTRERSHEIGVLKSLGMTPRQVRVMVVSSMVGLGALAGAVAVPCGVALQHWILPVMGDAAGIGLPRSIVDVYRPGELILLGLAGIAIAVAGALLPAGWVARSRVATALRAE